MKKSRSFISEIDVLILEKMLESKKEDINTNDLINLVDKQHKILKPHIDNLESKGLIERTNRGATKLHKIRRTEKNLAFIKQLIFLYKNRSL